MLVVNWRYTTNSSPVAIMQLLPVLQRGPPLNLPRTTNVTICFPIDALQMYKVDGSESRELQQQYGFRSIPMFLMFYQGKLVHAGNSIRTKDEFLAAATAALAAGRRCDFLPEGFKFSSGDDNAMLDSINMHMSLLGASSSSG